MNVRLIPLVSIAICATMVIAQSAVATNANCGGYPSLELSEDTKIEITDSVPILGHKLYNVKIVFSGAQRQKIDALLWGHGGHKTNISVCVNGSDAKMIEWYLPLRATHYSISVVMDDVGVRNILQKNKEIDVGSNGSSN